MKKLLAIILVISMSLVILVLSIENNAYNKNYFMKSYNKYNIEEVTSKTKDQLHIITVDMIQYLKHKGGNELLEPHFNEKEVLHMEDVQQLFDLARRIKYMGIIISFLIIMYFIKKDWLLSLGRTLFYGLFANYVLISVLGVLLLIDFNKYFTIFHLIFFTNELWILDPSTDLMIQMLPEQFFFGMAKNIGIWFFVYLAIVQLIGFLLIRKYNYEHKSKIIE